MTASRSARCSAASEASTSASSAPACASPGSARPTSSADGSFSDTGRMSPATATSASSTPPTSSPSTSSPADSPAKASAPPDCASDCSTPARVFGSEFARLVGELRPRWVVVENVPGLLVRGMGRVLGDLAALRYDAEWDCLPASAFGAPHRRDRVWLLAYPARDAQAGAAAQPGPEWQRARPGGQPRGADPDADRRRRRVVGLADREPSLERAPRREPDRLRPAGPVADPDRPGRGQRRRALAAGPDQPLAQPGGQGRDDPADQPQLAPVADAAAGLVWEPAAGAASSGPTAGRRRSRTASTASTCRPR